MKSFVLLIAYPDFLNGANNFERYITRLYVDVLTLDTIGLTGKLSMFPFTDILCILAVPYNFAGHDPVGYNFLYTRSVNFDFIFPKVR